MLHGAESWLTFSSGNGQQAAHLESAECMTSRAHNASYRHLNPPSKAAACFQWASSGTFPLGNVGKAIGFHTSRLSKRWHKPVGGRRVVRRLGQPPVQPLPNLRERQHQFVSPQLALKSGYDVLSEAEGLLRCVSTMGQPFLSQRCLVSYWGRMRDILRGTFWGFRYSAFSTMAACHIVVSDDSETSSFFPSPT